MCSCVDAGLLLRKIFVRYIFIYITDILQRRGKRSLGAENICYIYIYIHNRYSAGKKKGLLVRKKRKISVRSLTLPLSRLEKLPSLNVSCVVCVSLFYALFLY